MRVVCSGVVPVALPPHEAFALFTAGGERAWAEGWDPRFPVEPEDDALPGTVFETAHGAPTTWVVVACDPGRSIAYARVTPGDRAGTVTVELADAPAGTTLARVTYDLTALTPEADARLERFAADYDEMLAHWRDAIDSAVENRT